MSGGGALLTVGGCLRHTDPPARRALALAALTGACLVAALGIATDQASADYTARLQAGTLQLTGDAGGDTLTLTQGSAANALDVIVNGQLVSTFDRASFTAVAVEAGGGDDDRQSSSNDGSSSPRSVTIDGGAGDDTLIGATAPRRSSAAPATTSSTATSAPTRPASAGATTPSSGTRATAATSVEGEGGKDTLQFNGSNADENVDVTANGPRVLLSRDVASITMDLDGIENDRTIRALGGADTITVGDLAGTDVRAVNVDLAAFAGGGDGAADTVIAHGTDGRRIDVDVATHRGNAVVDGPSRRRHGDRRRGGPTS